MRLFAALSVAFVRSFLVFIFLFFELFFASGASALGMTPTPTLLPQPALNVPIIKGNAVSALSVSSLSDSETLIVPSDGTKVQSPILKNGQQYIIAISGTFIWGNCDKVTCPNGGPDYKRYGDAGYLTDDHWKSLTDPLWSSIVYLDINGSHFSPAVYAPGHVYFLDIKGSGKSVTFRINDCSYCYPDNSGYLTVEILSAQRNPLVLIPGIGGSELKTTEMKVWAEDNGHGGTFNYLYPSNETIWLNEDKAKEFGEDDYFDVLRMKTDGITSEVNIGITGNLVARAYQGTMDFFISNGYILNKDFFVFPYDWRRDISSTVSLLDQKINEIKAQTGLSKVDIVAHSMGGLVARNYIADSAKAKNVRKLFTLGTPHLGSVDSLKNLRHGNCLTPLPVSLGPLCLGIINAEAKDVVRNMISVFQLTPSQAYFDFYSGEDSSHPYPYKTESGGLSYIQIKNLLTGLGHNTSLFAPSETFHNLDNSLSNTNGVNVTVIAGSGRPTLGQIVEEKRVSLLGIPYVHKDMININGDGTVPLFSASLNDPGRNLSFFDSAKVFYTNQEHGQLVANGSALNLVKNILNNSNQLPDRVSSTPYSFSGTQVSVHSPVNIHVYDFEGRHTGPTPDGDFEANIPGSSYDTLDDAKFVFLPDDGQYDIKFEATDQGSFDFKIKEFENNTNTSTVLYSDMPLTADTKAETVLDTLSLEPPVLQIDQDGNGTIDKEEKPTAIIIGGSDFDHIPPRTAVGISGTKGNKSWYRSDVLVTLTAQDEASGSGVSKIEYSLDNGQTIQTYTEPFVVAREGRMKLQFHSADKAGNEEALVEIEIKIDKTPPEAKVFIDQTKLNFVLQGVDTNITTVKMESRTSTGTKSGFHTISDEAGNTMLLYVREENSEKQSEFRIYSLQYSNNLSVNLPTSYLRTIYQGRKGALSIKEQNFELKKEVKTRIQYDSRKNKSTIIVKEGKKEKVKEVRSGLVLLNLLTDKGQLKTSY
ncbi:MAG: alpha/beta hydrolase [Candidatus Levybacteria bacterium]|nr:alpha/beta hydrolase [Candidatus Levybacteria bacterium]